MSTAQDFLEDYAQKTQIREKEEENRKIVAEFNSKYLKAYQLWNTYQAEAYKDVGYYLGNQWSLEELTYLKNERRNAYTYNKVKRIVDLMSGYERSNRTAIVIQPTEEKDTQTADQYSRVIDHIMKSTGGYETFSDGFKGSLIAGQSFLSGWVDRRDDEVSGDIKFHLDSWNAVIQDPFFTKRDLSDCDFIARRKFLPPATIKSLLPNKAEEIDKLPYGKKDDKFTYMPFARQWGSQKLMDYTEYWRSTYETKQVLINRKTGEQQVWKGKRERFKVLQLMHPELELMRKSVKTVKLGIIVENELLYYGDNPDGLDDYPFVPILCVFEPSYDLYEWKIQSFIRVIRDSQTELNKRRSKIVDMMDATLNTGWKAKKNAVTNPQSLYQSGQGKVVWISEQAQLADAERLIAPEIPQSYMQMEERYHADILEDAGVNQEMFGKSENDKIETAAILARWRQAQGLVNQQEIFDNFRYAKKLMGEKLVKLIQANYTPEKIERMLGEKPAEEFYTQQFAKYDVDIAESVLTDSQKESNFLKYLSLKQMGIPIDDSTIVKASNLQDKNKLADSLDQKAQSEAKMAQMQQQVQMQQLQSQANLSEARAEADRGLAKERSARSIADIGLYESRKLEAVKDLEQANLDKIKAIKELQGIDLSQLQQLLDLAEKLRVREEKQITPETHPEENEQKELAPTLPE